MPVYDSLLDALNGLKQRGYTIDFNLAFDHVKCDKTGVCLSPSQFEITEHHRFEGISNPEDSSVVFAIESKDGTMKGVLVSAYGMYSEALSEEMLQKLVVHHG
ncbi:MAG TPA: hypothetical protein VN958_05540 [Chitinophagaceae bacterium]|nr:hypothetical protein [Chitinophagaceae bacterium]